MFMLLVEPAPAPGQRVSLTAEPFASEESDLEVAYEVVGFSIIATAGTHASKSAKKRSPRATKWQLQADVKTHCCNPNSLFVIERMFDVIRISSDFTPVAYMDLSRLISVHNYKLHIQLIGSIAELSLLPELPPLRLLEPGYGIAPLISHGHSLASWSGQRGTRDAAIFLHRYMRVGERIMLRVKVHDDQRRLLEIGMTPCSPSTIRRDSRHRIVDCESNKCKLSRVNEDVKEIKVRRTRFPVQGTTIVIVTRHKDSLVIRNEDGSVERTCRLHQSLQQASLTPFFVMKTTFAYVKVLSVRHGATAPSSCSWDAVSAVLHDDDCYDRHHSMFHQLMVQQYNEPEDELPVSERVTRPEVTRQSRRRKSVPLTRSKSSDVTAEQEDSDMDLADELLDMSLEAGKRTRHRHNSACVLASAFSFN